MSIHILRKHSLQHWSWSDPQLGCGEKPNQLSPNQGWMGIVLLPCLARDLTFALSCLVCQTQQFARLTPLWPWDALLNLLERFCPSFQLVSALAAQLRLLLLQVLWLMPWCLSSSRFQCPFRGCTFWWRVTSYCPAALARLLAAPAHSSTKSWSRYTHWAHDMFVTLPGVFWPMP